VSSTTLAQTTNAVNKDAKVKEELQKFFADLNEAITKKDRAALERLYADEFQFIRSAGAVNDKAAHIRGIMANDPISSTPISTPAFDQMFVYGDVALSRSSARGATMSSMFARKDGRWQAVQVQGTRLAPERKPIKLNPQVLNTFLGKYEFGPGLIATVTMEGDSLKWRGGNRMPTILVSLSETAFYSKDTEAEMTFTKNDKGLVTDVVLRLGQCQETKAKKIE
jgi:hypothetical protein